MVGTLAAVSLTKVLVKACIGAITQTYSQTKDGTLATALALAARELDRDGTARLITSEE
jgi:hypothetical protein